MVDKKFQFRINLQQLLEAQSSLSHAIGNKKNKPILQMVHCSVTKKSLILRGFNNMLQIERKIDIVNEGSEAVFCIPTFVFTVLNQYTNKKASVQFSQMGTDERLLYKFIVSQEMRSNEFTFVPADKFPDRVTFKQYKRLDLAKLLEAFRLTKVGAAPDAKKPALRCYLLNSSGVLLTGDGSQFAKYEGVILPGQENDCRLLIRAKMIFEESKLLEELAAAEDTEVALNDQWLSFRSKIIGAEVTFQQHNGEAVDLLQIFTVVEDTIKELELEDKVTKVEVSLFPLRQALQLAVLYEEQALLNAFPAYTTFKVASDGLTFEIQIQDLSQNEETIEFERFHGPQIEVKFLSSKLKDAISELTGDYVTFTFYSKNDPFRVTSPDYPGFVYLQSP